MSAPPPAAAAALPSAAALGDFAPMAERALSIDSDSVLRFRGTPDRIAGFVRLPFDVVAGRTVAVDGLADRFDVTFAAGEFLAWVDGDGELPIRRDARWLSPLPPTTGWQRLDQVPAATIRELVDAGAALARQTQSRAAQQSLLSSIVLTAVSSEDDRVAGRPRRADVPLGPLSALARLDFMLEGSDVAVDVAPGWTRVATQLGSAYATANDPLNLLSALS